eukprot:scaffold3924_cov109-Cylindrotheca_fusiformis.AAC.9
MLARSGFYFSNSQSISKDTYAVDHHYSSSSSASAIPMRSSLRYSDTTMNTADSINVPPNLYGDDTTVYSDNQDSCRIVVGQHNDIDDDEDALMMMDASHAMLTLRATPMTSNKAKMKTSRMITPSPTSTGTATSGACMGGNHHPHRLLAIDSLMELRNEERIGNSTAMIPFQQQQQQQQKDPLQLYQQTIACLEQIKKDLEREQAVAETKLRQAKQELWLSCRRTKYSTTTSTPTTTTTTPDTSNDQMARVEEAHDDVVCL